VSQNDVFQELEPWSGVWNAVRNLSIMVCQYGTAISRQHRNAGHRAQRVRRTMGVAPAAATVEGCTVAEPLWPVPHCRALPVAGGTAAMCVGCGIMLVQVLRGRVLPELDVFFKNAVVLSVCHWTVGLLS
jgi:hypothetical protein